MRVGVRRLRGEWSVLVNRRLRSSADRKRRRGSPACGAEETEEEDGPIVDKGCSTPNRTARSLRPPQTPDTPDGKPDTLHSCTKRPSPPSLPLSLGLQCVTALLVTEPWYTLKDQQDPEARLFELTLWRFVALMGQLDEEDCSVDSGGAFGGLGDSLRALDRRVARLVAHLGADTDSLSLLEGLCGEDPGADEGAWEPVMTKLLAALPVRPFLAFKVADGLPRLRRRLLHSGADPRAIDTAAEQARAVRGLEAALRDLLGPGDADPTDPSAAELGGADRNALAARRRDAVRLVNRCLTAFLQAFK